MIVVLVSQVDPGLSLRSAFCRPLSGVKFVSRGAVYRLLFQIVENWYEEFRDREQD